MYYRQRVYKGVGDGGIGNEATPQEYINNLILCFREVRRVLHDTGTCFVNLGDKRGGSGGSKGHDYEDFIDNRLNASSMDGGTQAYYAQPLNLLNIPARFSLAMQADGWIHRDTICWFRKRQLPESVHGTRWMRCRVKQSGRNENKPDWNVRGSGGLGSGKYDAKWADCTGCVKCSANNGWVLEWGSGRCSGTYEVIYMFTKTDKYFCDMEEVRTPHSQVSLERYKYGHHTLVPNDGHIAGGARTGALETELMGDSVSAAGANRKNVWDDLTFEGVSEYFCINCDASFNRRRTLALKKTEQGRLICSKCGSNEVTSHHAVFPVSLPTRCILMGSSPKVCATCLYPYARMLNRKSASMNIRVRDAAKGRLNQKWGDTYAASEEEIAEYDMDEDMGEAGATVGWLPTCSCPTQEPIAASVLDPFSGTGTTVLAAMRLGRKGFGTDLSENYIKASIRRLSCETLPMRL